MPNYASQRYWTALEKLPLTVQDEARRCYELFRRDPRHPSLQFKRVGRFWPVRVGLKRRALAIDHEGGLLWIWIGRHDEYERLISRR